MVVMIVIAAAAAAVIIIVVVTTGRNLFFHEDATILKNEVNFRTSNSYIGHHASRILV